MSKYSLAGKTALVTGANTGIGQAIAIELGAAGVKVICASRSNCDHRLSKIDNAQALHLDFADPMAAKDIFDS